MDARRVLVRVLLTAGAAALGVLGVQGAAQAGAGTGGSGTDGGYAVSASVVFSGDAAPGGGGTYQVTVPAQCWWTVQRDVPKGDPVAVATWYENTILPINGSFSGARGMYGSLEEYVDVATRQAAGEALDWYAAQCRDGDQAELVDFVGESYVWGINGEVAVNWQPFATGGQPEPQVSTEDLADIAYDNMVLVRPDVDRNPVSEVAGGATLVGLDTWFWVQNPAAVGGANGTRTIRADLGPVWAEVVATTGGLQISSQAGGTTCSPAEALSEDGACAVTFQRASTGLPVETSTTWAATWTGSGGTGGALGGRTEDADVVVPVVESQALVRRS